MRRNQLDALTSRLASLQAAGLRRDLTKEQFMSQMLSLGMNIYEKKILPAKLGFPPELERTPEPTAKIIPFPERGLWPSA